MQLALPPELEAFVQRQLSSGKYRNLLDLVLAAIKLLQQQDDMYQGRLLDLPQDAMVGWEASRQGRVVGWPCGYGSDSVELARSLSNARRMNPQFRLTEPAILTFNANCNRLSPKTRSEIASQLLPNHAPIADFCLLEHLHPKTNFQLRPHR